MKKTYPTEIVLSLTTGYLLKQGGLGEIQDLAEHVAGHSIFTHELVDKQLVTKLVARVHEQHPQLAYVDKFAPEIISDDLLRGAYTRAYVTHQIAKYGAELEIEGGTGERAENPVESFQRLIAKARVL